MHFFAGTSHPALGEALAKELQTNLGKVSLKAFSSGERYVRFDESIRGKEVYLLQTGVVNPSDALMELFLMCQAAKLSFASKVHVILPHFPYARQDRVAEPREPISAKLIANLLEEAGADHVITLNLHSDQIQGFFDIPVDALDARPLFADVILKKNLPNLVVVAPDIGSAKHVKKFADLIGTELAILHKSRKEHHHSEILHVVGDVEGKTCLIFDDMVDTAGTLVSAKAALLEHGANKDVYAAAVHGIFSGPAMERLKEADFAEVLVTDSIPQHHSSLKNLTVLPVAPMLAEVIRHVERGESVTGIYKK